MGPILKAAAFDWYQLLAYRKSMLFFFAYPLIMLLVTGESVSGVSFVGIMSIMTVGYAFSIEERYHTDRLPLPLDRRSKVLGRYLFTLSLLAALSLIGPAEAVAFSLVLGRELDLAAMMGLWLGVLLVVVIFASFQLPIFFRMGYMKSRFLAMIPFLLCCIALPAVIKLVELEEIRAFLNSLAQSIQELAVILPLSLLGTAAAVLAVSCLLSVRFYARREL